MTPGLVTEILLCGVLFCAAPAWGKQASFAQLRLFTATGTHQCSSGQSCVVSGGGFSNCNDATTALQTRDCCPTTPKSGTSTRFFLNYCIPDRPLD
jgi:hypothetical protein